MKKKFLLAILLILPFTATFAQKISIEKEEVQLKLKKSDFFKNIKTYNIIVQRGNWGGNLLSSGSSGEEFAHPETKTYEHLMSDQFLDEVELKRDTVNPDLKIYVGFNGSKPRISNNQLLLEGYFRYLILDSENNLLFQDHEKLNKYYLNYPEEFPTGNAEKFHIRMANLLKRYALDQLEELSLTTDYLTTQLPYGTFTKYKKVPELGAFNTKINEFIAKVKNSTLTQDEAKEYKTYFKSFEGKKLGKLKDKKRDQILALNTALVDLFSGNNEAFLETINNVKVGLLTLWPTKLKIAHEKINLLASNTNLGVTINEHPDLVNSMLFKDVKVKHGDKTYDGDITIERFFESDDNSLNFSSTAMVHILNDAGSWTNYFKGKENVQIQLNNGEILEFLKVGNSYLLAKKSNDGDCAMVYKMFANKKGEICKEGDKYILVKR